MVTRPYCTTPYWRSGEETGGGKDWGWGRGEEGQRVEGRREKGGGGEEGRGDSELKGEERKGDGGKRGGEKVREEKRGGGERLNDGKEEMKDTMYCTNVR